MDMMTDLNENLKQVGIKPLTQTASKALSVDSVILFLLALAPILQHYEGIFVNPSLAITVLLAGIALVRILFRKSKVGLGFVLLMFYSLYASFIHGINMVYFLREMTQLVIYLAVINGFFDIKKLFKIYCAIATCATILIIAQYFCFYVLGFHLQLVVTSLLDPDNSQWFDLVRTGLIAVTGKPMSFYRPSAFFLEPSHFAIYCIPVIVTTLFSRTGDTKESRRSAFLVSLGVFLSTSGMGIALVIMCWAIYLVFFFGQNGQARTIRLGRLFSLRSMLLIALLLFVLIILYATVPVFRQSVMRIFVTDGNASLSAIEGRTSTGLRSLKMLHGTRSLIGFGDIYDISDWNMAAFFFVTFKFGWVGAVLFYSFYGYSLLKVKREAQLMTIVFLILSFFTVHMFGAYYKMYYTMIILFGYVQNRLEKT